MVGELNKAGFGVDWCSVFGSSSSEWTKYWRWFNGEVLQR